MVPTRRGWAPWVALAAATAPLGVVVVELGQLVLGPTPTWLPGGEAGAGAYPRLAYFLQVADPDRVLVLPLLALAAVAWLMLGPLTARVREVALGLAGLLGAQALLLGSIAGYLWTAREPVEGEVRFYGGAKLEALGPTLTGAVLLLGLSAVVVHRLLLGVRPESALTDADECDDDADEGRAVPVGGPIRRSPVEPPAPRDAPEQDPHAAYRRPTSR